MSLHNANAVLGGCRLGRGDVKANGLSGMASSGGGCSGRGQDGVLTADSGELVLRWAGAAAVGTVLVGLWLGALGRSLAPGWVRQRAWQAAEWCI